MFSSTQLEFDIRSRCRWLAEALVSESNLGIDLGKIIEKFQEDSSQAMPAPDQMTWFAMERLSAATGLRAVKFEKPGQSISGASLVWVSPHVSPNPEDAKILSGAALAICNPDWLPLIQDQKQDMVARRKAPTP